jgi:hypothetical protein
MHESRYDLSRDGMRDGLGVAALVMGAVALTMVITFLTYPLGGLVALVAVVVGILGMRRAARGIASNRGQALAGVICGVLALALAVTFTVRIGTFAIEHQADLMQLSLCTSTADSDVAQLECLAEVVDRLQER